jgi:quinate dehydrogenase
MSLWKPESGCGASAIAQGPSQTPRNAYLFGQPVAHSLAPVLHNAVFKALSLAWRFHLFESLSHADFLSVMRREDFIGAAITTPHKVAFLKEVDEVTSWARVIGAINTVFVRHDNEGKRKYIGTNTDCVGVRDALVVNHPQVAEKAKGRPGLVLGGGGAARSAVYALAECIGSSVVYLVNRDKGEAEAVVSQFRDAGFTAEVLHVTSVAQVEALEAPLVVVGAVPDAPPATSEEREAREIVKAFLGKGEKGCWWICAIPQTRGQS